MKSKRARFNNYLKSKRSSNRAGFTLVEVIVTLVITMIVIGVSSAIIMSTTSIFGKQALRDMQLNVAETVLSFATDRMLYAYDILAVNSLTAPGQDFSANAIIGINNDGQLVYLRADDKGDPVNIFGSAFYNNYSAALVYSIIRPATGSASVVMNVVITDNRTGNEVLDRSMTRPLLNFSGAATGEITIGKNTPNRYIIIK